MVLEVWPITLPQAFVASGYGEATPKDNVITDDYNVGPPQYRRRTTSAPAPYAGEMFMTTAEWETLSTFFHTTLFDGVMRFLFPPQGVNDLARYWISRFVSPPLRRMSDIDDTWTVALNLERLAIGQAFLLPSTFRDPTVIYTPRIIYDQFTAALRYTDPDTIYAVTIIAPGADQTLEPSRVDNVGHIYTTTGSVVFDDTVFDSSVFD